MKRLIEMNDMQGIAPPGDGLAAPTSTLARLMNWHQRGIWQAVCSRPAQMAQRHLLETAKLGMDDG